MLQHQQEDLLNFGQLIVALGTGSLMATHNLQKSLELIGRQYSPDVKNVTMYLLSKPNTFKNVDELLSIMGPRILHEINNAHL